MKKGTTVIAEMNNEERLAFSLSRRCEEEAKRAELEAEFADEEEIERAALIRHSRMERMGTLFEGILWLSLWQRVGDEHESIAVTKGFKVIAGGHRRTLREILSSLGDDQP